MIRFDNRDAGLSTQIDAPVPNVMRLMAGLPTASPTCSTTWPPTPSGCSTTSRSSAPTWSGTSMGGMIAQTMAIARPERVLSLASMLSTTGDRRVGTPKLRVWSILMRRAPHDRDAYVAYFVRVFRMIGSPGYRRPTTASASSRPPPTTAAITRPAPRASWPRSWRPDRTAALRTPRRADRGDPRRRTRSCRSGRSGDRQGDTGRRAVHDPGMGHDMPRSSGRPSWTRSRGTRSARGSAPPRRARTTPPGAPRRAPWPARASRVQFAGSTMS